ncbi:MULTISPECIES: hypothetical protein [Flavobacterium]|uniref:hypothetical protein n=1 Tax=Flavobacterium TaxID=237 RepID=UPI001FCBE6CA|nr:MULTISPECIES: hypothetical protein [Flavobacterium]UOK42221.1 hypothetical protein LZF87_12990 [Flavobacterium enshiense]
MAGFGDFLEWLGAFISSFHSAFFFLTFGIFVNISNKIPPLHKAGGTLVASLKNEMKNLLYLITILTLFSCNEKSKSLAKQKVEIKKESKYSGLLKKFENISFDTLKIFSEENFKKFKGQELDSLDVILFPKEIAEHHFIDPPGIFACYKFSIDSSRIGLIARTPSEYLPSSIKLFVYNKEKDKITQYIELSESIGDAGDVLEKTAWLFKTQKKDFQSLVWVRESHYNSVEDENDTTIVRWDSHYLIDLSKPKFDTINKISKFLSQEFKNLLK